LNRKKRIVFLGASITQGKVSCNYVNILKKKTGTKSYRFINLGTAGFESFNVLKQLNKVISKKPDFVVILVGTNDVTSRKLKKIPHAPALHFYCANIQAIINRLKKETHSKIAISSIPVLGEDLESIENVRICEYNTELKRISENEKIAYLPVNEQQKDYLEKEVDGKGKKYENDSKMPFRALVQHFILGKSFDEISKRNGFLLLTDGIHLNSRGAAMIANEIEKFLNSP
jgi:lysophospholipase L1-like esterase